MSESLLKQPPYDSSPHLNRHGIGYGKPTFPKLDQTPESVVDQAGPSSMRFFKVLNLDASFLNEDPATWDTCSSYIRATCVVRKFRFVNDTAECGVKLGLDFLNTAKKETRFQKLLQVVENDRKRLSNQRAPKKEPKYWFLAMENSN